MEIELKKVLLQYDKKELIRLFISPSKQRWRHPLTADNCRVLNALKIKLLNWLAITHRLCRWQLNIFRFLNHLWNISFHLSPLLKPSTSWTIMPQSSSSFWSNYHYNKTSKSPRLRRYPKNKDQNNLKKVHLSFEPIWAFWNPLVPEPIAAKLWIKTIKLSL